MAEPVSAENGGNGVITVRNMMVNGGVGPKADGTIATSRFNFPTVRARAALETVHKFYILRLDGAPTAASITARFDMGIGTTATPEAPTSPNELFYADDPAQPRWFTDGRPQFVPMNEVEHGGLLPDGDWPAPLASTGFVGPALFIRRVKGGFDHRLSVNPNYSGGTSPKFIFTYEFEVRYDA